MFTMVQEVSNVFYDCARFVQSPVARMRQGTNYQGIRVMLFSNVSDGFQLQIYKTLTFLRAAG